MKTLYLECGMGAAGDMLTAALLELTEDKQAFVDQMNALGLPGVHSQCSNAHIMQCIENILELIILIHDS